MARRRLPWPTAIVTDRSPATIAAGEDARMAGHHVGPTTTTVPSAPNAIPAHGAESRCRSSGPAPAPRRRLTASRTVRSAAGWPSASSAIISTVRVGPDDLLDGGEPFDLDAFLERLVGLEGVRRHMRAVAAVDDQRLVGAQALRRARGVHRGVAAAVDDHPAAQQRRLAGLDIVQQRNRVEHAHRVARRNVDMLADVRADREERRVEPPAVISASTSSTL
jgi:hypothetical protein